MKWSGLLLAAVTSTLLHCADCNLVCLFDHSVPDPSQVNTVARCGPHEVCSMEQYILPSGQVRHNLHCRDKQQCGSVSSSINTVVCSECCDTDLCAASLCKNQGLPSGKICFHCDHPVKTPHSCEHIKVCGVDENCHTSQLPTSEYEVQCKPKASCATTASQPNLCTNCCSGNLCNDRCGYASSQSACVDDSICLGLKQNFHNNGRDVCTDPTFKKFCNSTCGLCPMTAPVTTTVMTTVMTSPATQANACVPDPCKHGICSLQGGTGYHCTCYTGFLGTNCDKDDACHANNPCKHGLCSLTSAGSAKCTCNVGYSGTNCDVGTHTTPLPVPTNPCVPDPCQHGICSLQGSTGHHCTCNTGYIGTNCDKVDPCQNNNPCRHGSCSLTSSGSAHCTCFVGYSGTHCDIGTTPVPPANPCLPDPCQHGICSLQGSSGYRCTCNSGYIGTNCDKDDPCLSHNPCVHGHCSITSAGSAHCTCYVGYSGTHCNIGATTVAPANPCLPDPCLHGICSLQPSSGYHCTCNTGYIGTNCDKDDPCHSQNPCVHGHCSITSTGSAQCTCFVGYSGNHCDIDSACHPSPCLYGTCSSQAGSTNYHCTCNQGYGGKNCDTLSSPCASSPCQNGQCTSQGTSYHCHCNIGYTGSLCDKKIRDCSDVYYNQIPSPSGDNIFTIKIGQRQENVRCDMTTAGGGWTVIMNREHPDLDFKKDSTEYALGFGTTRQDFWLGLEDVHALTSDGRKYQLRVELTRADGSHYYEVYDDFSVGPRPDFILHIGQARGTAGDALKNHNGYGFTTKDVDRDSNKLANCANYLQGAWWFYDCYDSCLTCPYVTPGIIQCRSMSWNTIKYCEALRAARMLVKPM